MTNTATALTLLFLTLLVTSQIDAATEPWSSSRLPPSYTLKSYPTDSVLTVRGGGNGGGWFKKQNKDEEASAKGDFVPPPPPPRSAAFDPTQSSPPPPPPPPLPFAGTENGDAAVLEQPQPLENGDGRNGKEELPAPQEAPGDTFRSSPQEDAWRDYYQQQQWEQQTHTQTQTHTQQYSPQWNDYYAQSQWQQPQNAYGTVTNPNNYRPDGTIQTLESELAALMDSVANLTQTNSNLTAQHHETQSLVDALQVKLVDAECHAAAESMAALEYKENCTRLEQQCDDLEKDVDELELVVCDLEDGRSNDTMKIVSLQAEVDQIQTFAEDMASALELSRLKYEKQKLLDSRSLFEKVFGSILGLSKQTDKERIKAAQELSRKTLMGALQNERESIAELEDLLSELEYNNTALATVMASRDELIEELSDRIEVFEDDKIVLKAALRQLQEEMKNEEPKVKMLHLDLESANNEISKLQSQVEALHGNHNASFVRQQSTLQSKDNEILQLQAEAATIAGYVDQLEDRLASFHLARRDITERESRLEETQKQHDDIVTNLQMEMNQSAVDCDELRQRVETLEEECNRLLDESNVSIKKIEASSCQMNELKDLIVMMEEKLEMKEDARKEFEETVREEREILQSMLNEQKSLLLQREEELQMQRDEKELLLQQQAEMQHQLEVNSSASQQQEDKVEYDYEEELVASDETVLDIKGTSNDHFGDSNNEENAIGEVFEESHEVEEHLNDYNGNKDINNDFVRNVIEDQGGKDTSNDHFSDSHNKKNAVRHEDEDFHQLEDDSVGINNNGNDLVENVFENQGGKTTFNDYVGHSDNEVQAVEEVVEALNEKVEFIENEDDNQTEYSTEGADLNSHLNEKPDHYDEQDASNKHFTASTKNQQPATSIIDIKGVDQIDVVEHSRKGDSNEGKSNFLPPNLPPNVTYTSSNHHQKKMQNNISESERDKLNSSTSPVPPNLLSIGRGSGHNLRPEISYYKSDITAFPGGNTHTSPNKPVIFRSLRKTFARVTGVHGFFSLRQQHRRTILRSKRKDGNS